MSFIWDWFTGALGYLGICLFNVLSLMRLDWFNNGRFVEEGR